MVEIISLPEFFGALDLEVGASWLEDGIHRNRQGNVRLAEKIFKSALGVSWVEFDEPFIGPEPPIVDPITIPDFEVVVERHANQERSRPDQQSTSRSRPDQPRPGKPRPGKPRKSKPSPGSDRSRPDRITNNDRSRPDQDHDNASDRSRPDRVKGSSKRSNSQSSKNGYDKRSRTETIDVVCHRCK